MKLEPSTSQRGARGFERLYVECIHHGHYCTLKRPMGKMQNKRFRERAPGARHLACVGLCAWRRQMRNLAVRASRTQRLNMPNSTAPQFERERQALIKTQACRTASRCHFGFNDIEQVLMGVDIELRVDMLNVRLHRVA